MTPNPDFNQSIPHTACAVCGHVLNHYKGPLGESWIHTLESDDDHAPIPVPVDSIHTTILCDFCLAPNAPWVLPVEDYETGEHDANVGDWAVCDSCAALIGKNDWDGLTTRVMEAMRKRRGAMTPPRKHFDDLYRELRTHIIGHLHTTPKTNND